MCQAGLSFDQLIWLLIHENLFQLFHMMFHVDHITGRIFTILDFERLEILIKVCTQLQLRRKRTNNDILFCFVLKKSLH